MPPEKVYWLQSPLEDTDACSDLTTETRRQRARYKKAISAIAEQGDPLIVSVEESNLDDALRAHIEITGLKARALFLDKDMNPQILKQFLKEQGQTDPSQTPFFLMGESLDACVLSAATYLRWALKLTRPVSIIQSLCWSNTRPRSIDEARREIQAAVVQWRWCRSDDVVLQWGMNSTKKHRI